MPENYKLVTYVDKLLLSSWGANSYADALAVPGYSPDVKYNVIILAFAADIYIRPLNYIDKDNNPFGPTKFAIQDAWVDAYHRAGKYNLVSAYGSTLFSTS